MKGVKKTALAAILAAIAVVIMYAGSLLGKIDIATAVIASLSVMITLGELGYGAAFAVYGVVSVLSFVLVPSKTPAVLFAVLFGLYPVVRGFAQSRFGMLSAYAVKYVYLNVMIALLLVITAVFFAKLPLWIVVLCFAAANLLLPIYDLALSSIMSLYYTRFRRKMR